MFITGVKTSQKNSLKEGGANKMNKTFLKGFVCGVLAIMLMFLFIKLMAYAVSKEATHATSRSEDYASEMEAARRENEGLLR